MMTEQELREKLCKLVQPMPEETHRAFLRAACGKEVSIVKRKLSFGLVLALVLIFLTTAIAFALTGGFGILDYNTSQKNNKEYIGHILGIHESYENEYMDMSINEAIFDGVSLSLTMNINHHEGADPVYIIPRLMAEAADGRSLEVDVEGYRGGSWHSGFFLPSRDPTVMDDGRCGVDAVILTDSPDGETTLPDTQKDAVTWLVRFYILHPEYPIVASPNPREANPSDQEYLDTEQAWMESFAEAYRNQIIQTDGYGSVVEYALSLPHDGMDDDAWFMLPLEEQLLQSGAFALVDTVEVSFTTGERDVKTAQGDQSFDLGNGWQLEVQDVSVTFARCDVTFLVSRRAEDGKTASELRQAGTGWSFAVLADGQTGTFRAGSVAPEFAGQEETGNLLYHFTMETGSLPQTLSLLSQYHENSGSFQDWLQQGTSLSSEQEGQLLPITLY